MIPQEFIKKRIPFNFSGHKLAFDVNQSLFSSFKIDDGTKSLLNSIRKNENINSERVLDLGCGYGVAGIFLKKDGAKEVHCTDRDLMAVEFAKHNSELNDCKIKSYGSLDYERIKEGFDLIVCNFPAKLGKEGLKKFVWEGSKHLNRKGTLAIVIVKELEKEFEGIIREEIFVEYREKKKGYLVYHLKFSEEIDYNKEVYERGKLEYKIDDKVYEIVTSKTIPEFDRESFSTGLIKENVLNGKAEEVDIINPFQGHKGILVCHYLKPKRINLISRDLLSLKYSKKNLERNGFDGNVVESYFPRGKRGELLIWVFDKDEDLKQISYKLEAFRKNYRKIIISGEKKTLKRLIKEKGIKKGISTRGNFMSVIVRQNI